MPMNAERAMVLARATISDMRNTLSVSNCNRLHADVLGYCRALLECGLIDPLQWETLCDEAKQTMHHWRLTVDVLPDDWLPQEHLRNADD